MSDGTMTDTADGNVATGDLRIAFAALVEALHDNSLDAIVEVVGAPAEYNRGKAAMREWFMNRLRYFLATISAPGTPVVPPLSNAEAVVPASPSPPVGGGSDASTRTAQSHARQEPVAQARPLCSCVRRRGSIIIENRDCCSECHMPVRPDRAAGPAEGDGVLPRWITAAAIRQVGFLASVEAPCRHHDIIHALARSGVPTPICGEQGFLDSAGAFVGRKDAMRIAIDARQLIPRAGQHGPEGELYSEDLW